MVGGLVLYVLFSIISLFLVFGGVITCNAFVTDGPMVKESILCGSILTIVGVPFMSAGELMEDISSGTITHLGLYLSIIGWMLVYLGAFSLIGYLYGKNKNKIE